MSIRSRIGDRSNPSHDTAPELQNITEQDAYVYGGPKKPFRQMSYANFSLPLLFIFS